MPITLNGSTGITTPGLTNDGSQTITGGTANGVAYLNGSKVLTTGSALTFDGTGLGIQNSGAAATANGQNTLVLGSGSGSGSTGDRGMTIFTSATSAGTIAFAKGTTGSDNYRGYLQYTHSNDALAFAVAASEQMRLTSTGLGIGTSSPDVKLVVKAGNGNQLVLDNAGETYTQMGFRTNGTARATIWATASEFSLYTYSTQPIIFSTNATERMRLDSSGRLGINTTSPAALLDIRNTYGNGGGIVRLGTSGDGIVIDGALGSVDFFNSDSDANKVAAQVAGKSGDLYGGGGYLTFSTSVFGGSLTQRARVEPNGNFVVGAPISYTESTTPGQYLEGTSGTWLTRDSNAPLHVCRTTTTGELVYFFYAGSIRGNISTNGSTVAYNTSSDYRLKENIQPMTGALARVAALKPCTYKWKEDGSDGEGFIAHELAEVCPNAVTGEKDAVNEDGSIKPQGIDTSFLVATLTAAIQELNAKLEAQAAEIAALKGTA